MSRQWKVDERKVARALGGVRIALSGGRGASANCDVLTPDWSVEVKRRARCVLTSWYGQAVVQARKNGRKPLLVVHVANSQMWLAVMSLSDLADLLGVNSSDLAQSCDSAACSASLASDSSG